MIRNRLENIKRNFMPVGQSNSKYMLISLVVLIIVLFVIYYYFDNIKALFSESFSVFPASNGPNIKDLDVLFFYDPKNNFSQDMIAVMKKENTLKDVEPVDITTPEGQKLVEKFNVKHGIPAFISLKQKTMSVGSKDTTAEVVSELIVSGSGSGSGSSGAREMISQGSGQEQSSDPLKQKENMINGLKIWAFTNKNCGHCKHFKNDLQSLKDMGMNVDVKIFDSMDDPAEFKKAASMAGLTIEGVPVFYSNVSKKNEVGYRSVDDIISKLQ